MDLQLIDRVAVVTGASRGIGRAIAARLLAEGCYIALVARGVDELSETAAALGKRCVPVVGDVTSPDDCARIMVAVQERFEKLDILVCNVGSGASVPPGQETNAEWHRMLDLNVTSATNMVKAAQPSLIDSAGKVLCISSICGLETLGAPVTYSAAKAALNAFVRGIARPLGQHGVTINAIAPGNILFPGSVWDRKLGEHRDAVEAMLESQVALRRLGKAEEIADLAAFLVSRRADFITGTVVVADGGQVRS